MSYSLKNERKLQFLLLLLLKLKTSRALFELIIVLSGIWCSGLEEGSSRDMSSMPSWPKLFPASSMSLTSYRSWRWESPPFREQSLIRVVPALIFLALWCKLYVLVLFEKTEVLKNKTSFPSEAVWLIREECNGMLKCNLLSSYMFPFEWWVEMGFHIPQMPTPCHWNWMGNAFAECLPVDKWTEIREGVTAEVTRNRWTAKKKNPTKNEKYSMKRTGCGSNGHSFSLPLFLL